MMEGEKQLCLFHLRYSCDRISFEKYAMLMLHLKSFFIGMWHE